MTRFFIRQYHQGNPAELPLGFRTHHAHLSNPWRHRTGPQRHHSGDSGDQHPIGTSEASTSLYCPSWRLENGMVVLRGTAWLSLVLSKLLRQTKKKGEIFPPSTFEKRGEQSNSVSVKVKQHTSHHFDTIDLSSTMWFLSLWLWYACHSDMRYSLCSSACWTK